MENTKICPHCKKNTNIEDFYKRRDKDGNSSYCKTCSNIQSKARQQALKKKSVEYKGGSCVACGYNKYLGALEFHHINPEEKEFVLSNFRGSSFEKIKKELDKCVLLCANCHREVHGLYKIVEWDVTNIKSTSSETLDSYQKPVRETKAKYPSDEELSQLVWNYPRNHLSKVFGVSDVAIAKYLKRRNIEQPPRGYWSKCKSLRE